MKGSPMIAALGSKPRTTKLAAGHKIYPYLLRDLVIDPPNQVWAADITYRHSASTPSTSPWHASAGRKSSGSQFTSVAFTGRLAGAGIRRPRRRQPPDPNARQSGRERHPPNIGGHHVCVSLATTEGPQLTVADTGPGTPAESAARPPTLLSARTQPHHLWQRPRPDPGRRSGRSPWRHRYPRRQRPRPPRHGCVSKVTNQLPDRVAAWLGGRPVGRWRRFDDNANGYDRRLHRLPHLPIMRHERGIRINPHRQCNIGKSR